MNAAGPLYNNIHETTSVITEALNIQCKSIILINKTRGILCRSFYTDMSAVYRTYTLREAVVRCKIIL
jgi:hypothetical protein